LRGNKIAQLVRRERKCETDTNAFQVRDDIYWKEEEEQKPLVNVLLETFDATNKGETVIVPLNRG